MKEVIYNHEDLLKMLDSMLREPSDFWDGFYKDRQKPIPFFVQSPDENLVRYYGRDWLREGSVLELGCGPGRNAIYFAQKGCEVDAVDISKESIIWAKERAVENEVHIQFIHENIFDLNIVENSYDIIYDSGCFHHIAPHRRISYLNLVKRALKPNGYFALTCFRESGELGGASMTDWAVYREKSLNGGLGYTEEKLRKIFIDFKEIEIRSMEVIEQPNRLFGVPGLLTALFQKKG
ncbi:class I SAM-dependent methyltransferase [Cytobacillus kochii]|uniref:class I SAM-dependent methyltransferase n=1 Tax=Cytobacillus kochii TaxID=859143 RepID=UPI00277D7F6A|nr:class I SAM-dependent methyltransferase [Cytobacillus kochii]MDQ0186558.1 SAM-dependent methyltransferase [Cytobacillus kochii]